jgi:flagellin
MLQRIRELAVQSSSGTYGEEDRTNMQVEVSALTAQIDDVLKNSKFNGVTLFSSDDKNVDIQVGSESGNTVKMNFSSLNLSAVTGTTEYNKAPVVANPPVENPPVENPPVENPPVENPPVENPPVENPPVENPPVENPPVENPPVEIKGLNISGKDATNAKAALTTLDTALKSVATTRANLGASQSRLNSVVSNLTTNTTNLTAARSQIEDADFATETTALAKAQILSQASTAMLAQANQSQQGVLKLLG